MGRGFGRKARAPKNPWAAIPAEWRDAVDQSSEEDIRKRVSETALAEHENKRNLAKDQDVIEKKAALKYATEGYREVTKVNTLKISYARQVLEARGKL
jgi:hypothetical protein